MGLLATPAHSGASSPSASASIGYDVSYPQCGGVLPTPAGFGIVGVNDGYPLSLNPCLGSELQWAQSAQSGAPAFYMNTASPGPAYSSHWPVGQQSPEVCDGSNSPACSYDYGWNNAQPSFNNAVSAESTNASTSPTSAAQSANWWLDVETVNSWETLEPSYGPTAISAAIDQASLEGSMAYFSSAGVSSLGIYSTASQWTAITGGTGSTFAAVPVWMPSNSTLSAAESACLSASFTGGRVAMIQYPSNGFDGDYLCGLLSAPAVSSVTSAASGSFTYQLVTSNNNGTVTYTQTSGAPALRVDASGVVETNGALAAGVYSASGTTSDPNGDSGTYSFTLTVTPSGAVAPRATKVMGHAVAGRTVVLRIAGTGFYGRPLVTGHSGTTAKVMKDTGTLLTLRVSVRRGSRKGTFAFTLTWAKGQSLRVKYYQS